MPINKVRRALYFVSRILGDVNAIKRKKVGKRIGRRIAGKASGRLLGKFFK